MATPLRRAPLPLRALLIRCHHARGHPAACGNWLPCACLPRRAARTADYFFDKQNGESNGGNRYATVLMYLNDVEEGGETGEPPAGALCRFAAVAGHLLVQRMAAWPVCTCRAGSLCTLPVLSGTWGRPCPKIRKTPPPKTPKPTPPPPPLPALQSSPTSLPLAATTGPPSATARASTWQPSRARAPPCSSIRSSPPASWSDGPCTPPAP